MGLRFIVSAAFSSGQPEASTLPVPHDWAELVSFGLVAGSCVTTLAA